MAIFDQNPCGTPFGSKLFERFRFHLTRAKKVVVYQRIFRFFLGSVFREQSVSKNQIRQFLPKLVYQIIDSLCLYLII